jgi:hypothetical protein
LPTIVIFIISYDTFSSLMTFQANDPARTDKRIMDNTGRQIKPITGD